MRTIKLLIAGASSLLGAGGAAACSVPRAPLHPLFQKYDAAAFATVTSVGELTSNVTVERVMHGTVPEPIVTLHFETWPGSCGPGGPRVKIGEKLVVYFINGGVSRWGRPRELLTLDPYVEAFMAPVDPSEQRRLIDRAKEVTANRGPVPASDPATWSALFAGGVGWTASSNVSRVRFDVADDGTLSNCRVYISSDPAERDHLLCPALTGRGRFKAPLLSQERTGIYEVRWDQEPAR